ncbi:MAG: ABC transporter substrate-binding protein, partial [Archangium sp.]
MTRRFLVGLFVVALPACQMCAGKTVVDAGVADAGPPVLTEKEPNDSAAQALVLSGSGIVEANLGADPAKPDSDWYVLQSALPRTVDVAVTAPNGADISLEVVDETGGVLAAVNAGGVGATERLPNLDVSSKTFLRVVSLKKGIGGAYTFTAKFSDRMPGYELEPNERKVDASPVALGQAISGTVGHAGDVDWYRYELPADEETPAPLEPVIEDGGLDAGVDGGVNPLAEKRLALRIDISAVEGVVTDVQLLTEAEAVLFQAKSKENSALSLRNVGVRAADKVIYVAVKSGNKKSNADVSYTLTVAPEDTGDNAEFEPNDELSRATDVPPNSYRDGFISPKGDVDYFRLVTDGPSIATLQVSGVDKVDLQLSVVKPVDGKADEVLLKANEGGSKEPEQLNSVSCDGVCFIRIEAASKKVDGKWVKEDENGDQAYRLTATVVPDDGSVERETNNTVTTATKIEFGKPVRGTVFPKKDVDYFSLDLS